MKSVKKIIASVIACALVFAMAVPFSASAAEGTVRVIIDEVNTTPRTEVLVPVCIKDATVGAFQFKVTFNPDELQYVKCEAGPELANLIAENEAIFASNPNNAQSGEVIIGAAITKGWTFEKAPLLLTFNTGDPAETVHAQVDLTVERIRTGLDEPLTPTVITKPVNVVVKHVDTVSFTETEVTLREGETASPEFTVTPADCTDVLTYTWSSDNEAAATVSDEGVITAVAAGTANVKLSVNGKEAMIKVTVKPKFKPGDHDLDGAITVNDALLSLRFASRMATPTEDDITIGDVDGDGAITVNDALLILRVAARISDKF